VVTFRSQKGSASKNLEKHCFNRLLRNITLTYIDLFIAYFISLPIYSMIVSADNKLSDRHIYHQLFVIKTIEFDCNGSLNLVKHTIVLSPSHDSGKFLFRRTDILLAGEGLSAAETN
jgi:hypothetical protein